jgi:hypothetical protein
MSGRPQRNVAIRASRIQLPKERELIMLTKQQCALLKAQAKQQVEEKLSSKPKEVEVEVSMQSAFNQFSLTIYKQHKE